MVHLLLRARLNGSGVRIRRRSEVYQRDFGIRKARELLA